MNPPVPYANLAEMGLDSSRFVWSDHKSVRGPCPKCGGTRRFVVFVDRPFPAFWGMCDQCGTSGWANQLCPSMGPSINTISREDLDQLQQAYDMELEARKLRRESRLQQLRSSDLHIKYHKNLTPEHRAYWENQGISEEWQNYYTLGYCPLYTFEHGGVTYNTDAYTIPRISLQGDLANLDYRLISSPGDVGKYRYIKDLPPAPFFSRFDAPELTEDGRIIIVEGAKKAMVVATRLPGWPQVVGVPSCNSWAGIDDLVIEKKVDRVVIVMDPDAQIWAWKKARQIGKAARVVSLPAKIDDMLINYGLSAADLQKILERGRSI